MPVSQDRLSRVYRWWQVTTPNDLTAATARVAFTAAAARPVTEDWTDADLILEGTTWWVRLLVGPAGDVELAPDSWQEWVEVGDTPELIVLKPGVTVVT